MIDFLEFEKKDVPVDKLKELGITYTSSIQYYYNGIVYICNQKVHCDNLYLDELMENGNDGSVYIFTEEVVVNNALIQENQDYGPTVVFLKDVRAKNIWVGGSYVSFEKNVEVEQTFIGVYNHGEVYVIGELVAEIVVNSDHMMSIPKMNVKYDVGFDDDDDYYYDDEDDCSDDRTSEILQSKYYDKWNRYIDNKAILNAIKKGIPIVRGIVVKTKIEKRFDKMNKGSVKKLDLSYLELKEIPKEVWEIEDLVSLNIAGAYIDSLPSEISNLKKLQVLNISDCNFEEFPMEVLSLENLRELDISFMPLNELPIGFEKLQSLKKLNLKGCEFQEVPEVLSKLPLLSHLDFSQQECDAPIVFSIELPKLRSLSVAQNHDISLIGNYPNLTNLNISDCQLQELSSNVINMSKLSTLYMHFNCFKGLPKEFVQLKNIKDLFVDLITLKGNEIDILKQFTSLKTIRVNNSGMPSFKIETLLPLSIWTKLYTTYRIEDMFSGKKILERKNLELVMMDGEKMEIEYQRKILGIVF